MLSGLDVLDYRYPPLGAQNAQRWDYGGDGLHAYHTFVWKIAVNLCICGVS